MLFQTVIGVQDASPRSDSSKFTLDAELKLQTNDEPSQPKVEIQPQSEQELLKKWHITKESCMGFRSRLRHRLRHQSLLANRSSVGLCIHISYACRLLEGPQQLVSAFDPSAANILSLPRLQNDFALPGRFVMVAKWCPGKTPGIPNLGLTMRIKNTFDGISKKGRLSTPVILATLCTYQ